MSSPIKYILVLSISVLLFFFNASAQIGGLNRVLNKATSPSGNNQNQQGEGKPEDKKKSELDFEHRDPAEDSITISFRYFNDLRTQALDTTINDFAKKYPVPLYYRELSNFGGATRSLIFNPIMRSGFDAGFHAFDIYRYKIEDTRFFQSTRPYTELAYMIGSRAEQMINVLHTQNRTPDFNFVFEYRLISAPGAFKGQNTVDNSLRFNTDYRSPNKRYNMQLIFVGNKVRSGENGGVQSTNDVDSLASDKNLNDPAQIPTRLNNSGFYYSNPYTTLNTSSRYSNNTFLLQHSYDIVGQKDSLVHDTVVVKLFYPRLRLLHTFQYTSSLNAFTDNVADSINYKQFFNTTLPKRSDTISHLDRWRFITNEFSLISYPVKNNAAQFLRLGAGFQALSGKFFRFRDDTTSTSFSDIYLTGEYRNRTRNQRWDMIAKGDFHLAGEYAGNYSAFVSLKSLITKKSSLELGFQNVNRTPSYVFNDGSAFPIIRPQGGVKNENLTRFFASIGLPYFDLKLNGEYFLISNYAYFDNFFSAKQSSDLIHVLHLGADAQFKLTRRFNLYSRLDIQQPSPNSPINLPLVLSTNRLVYENHFFKRLYVATGVEFRYYTPYKADNYSPFAGQFFSQDGETIGIRPDINAFLNFRIRTFKAFIRAENLNSMNLKGNTNFFRFNTFNYSAPYYPARAFWLRIGMWWSFLG